MAQLHISGKLTYPNGAPVVAARIRVYDLDGIDNSGDHDLIFNKTTNSDGRYSGQSTEWQDREGQMFGIDIPDVLRLEFLVNADGKSHRGPLFRRTSDGSCTDIVLPWQPPKPVGKDGRELVQIIALSDDYKGHERTLYQGIETASAALTSTVLGGLYRRITFLKGTDATLNGFVNALRTATGQAATEAIDVIVTTHGRGDELTFFDARNSDSAVQEALTSGLDAAARRKFRVLFSTACFGKTHLDSWVASGFNEASGSVGIYADSAVSYLPFLTAWAQERSFAEAVAAANAADPLNLADGAARQYYLSSGKPGFAAQVNSDRSRSGSGTTRIYTKP